MANRDKKGGLLFADVASILSGLFFVDVIIKGGIRSFVLILHLKAVISFIPSEALLKIDDQSALLINSPRLISIFEASNGHG